MHKCLNCGTDLSDSYCPHCGQKAATHRITFASVLHDIPHSVFHIDKGLVYTFINLLYRPGKVTAEYVQGKRVNFFSPLSYLLLLCAASSFLSHQASETMHIVYSLPPSTLFPAVAGFYAHYPALMFCSIIPFISFWNFVFKYRTGYNYWELFILNTYLMAQFNIFFIIFYVLQIMGIYTTQKVTAMLVCFIFYLFLGYTQFFSQKFTLRTFASNLLMYVFIIFTLLTGLSVTGFMTKWWWW